MSTPASIAVPIAVDPAHGRGWLWLGVGVALGAIAMELGQLAMKILTTPWYLPVFGTIGAVLVLYSYLLRRTSGRLLVLIFFAVLAGFQWWLLLVFTRVPAYSGPAVGAQVPAFTTQRADGKPFTQEDLLASQDTVLVLYRGRW